MSQHKNGSAEFSNQLKRATFGPNHLACKLAHIWVDPFSHLLTQLSSAHSLFSQSYIQLGLDAKRSDLNS